MFARRSRFGLFFLFLSLFLVGCGGGGSGSAVRSVTCSVPEPLRFSQPAISGARISGMIEIEANARVDKDTAELVAEFGFPLVERVEQLPAAVILGGYISGVSGNYEPGFGADSFPFPEDDRDRYCIDLEPAQQVEVRFFGSSESNRLRLLRVSDGTVVADTGFDASRTKVVSLPSSDSEGAYVIELAAGDRSGPTRYVLSSSPTGEGQSQDWAPGEFVPGEAVVMLSRSGQVSAQAVGFEAQMNLERALGENQHRVAMPSALMAQAQTAVERRQQTIEWVRELRKRPDVAFASPNYLFEAYAFNEWVSEPLFPEQWHYPLINLPQAWQLVPGGGEGVRVAVLDTGLFQFNQKWHEDIQPNLLLPCDPTTCLDFVDGDSLPADPGSAVGGSVYHGTHVAGTIAAGDVDAGGAGVAPNATILPARVLNENGSGTLADVIAAINWAREAGADVINLSLGSPGQSDNLRIAVDNAVGAGVLIVAAAGNSPTDQPVFPAAYDNVFGVGAVDGAGVRAGYSSIGPSVNLVAPGGDASRDANLDGRADLVISASGDKSLGFTYSGLQGTSMAAPHTSGVFALMRQLDSGIDTERMRALLRNGEITQRPPEALGYGAGLIDAARAVEAASTVKEALLSPTESVLKFASTSDQARLILERIGDPASDITLERISVPEHAPWLTVGQPVSVDGGFELPVSIDRDQLDPGRSYRSELTVVYQTDARERTLVVPVVIPVFSPDKVRESGVHFVLLIDEQNQPVAQTALASTEGFYSFAFEVVEPGVQDRALYQVPAGQSYFLVAGTDLDNDGVICTAGEACAEYPIAGLREKITVVLEGDSARVENGDGQTIRPSELVMTTSFSRPHSAQSLPRPGFDGYKLIESQSSGAPRSVAE